MAYKNAHMILSTKTAILLLCLTLPISANAQSLTEQNIRNFYKELNAFYQTPKVKIKPYVAFLDKHYAQDGALKVNVTDSITKQTGTHVFSKDNLISTTQSVYAEATIDKASITVNNVRITQNPKSAVAKYYFLFEGTHVQTTSYGKKIPFSYKSLSSCSDLLQERNGVITIYKSICDIEAMSGANALVTQKPKTKMPSNFIFKFKDFIKY